MSKDVQFKIKRKGYDTFAVDSYISQLKQEGEFTNAKLEVYRKQLDFLYDQLEIKQEQSLRLVSEVKILQHTIENMVSVEEIEMHMPESKILDAQETADEIILEALLIAKEVLDNVAHTASNTKEYRDDLKNKLNEILDLINEIEVIEPFDFQIE